MERPTEIACVVDQSGSMYKVKEEAIGGFNQFLEDQRSIDGGARLTLTLFNHECRVVVDSAALDEVEPLDGEIYRPKGMTALDDAIGLTVRRLEQRRAARSDGDVSGRALVLILTDGKENASSRYGREEVADLIGEREGREDWEFLFWGANLDARRVAGSLNIPAENVRRFCTTGEHLESVFGQMSRATQSFRETGDFGELDELGPPESSVSE